VVLVGRKYNQIEAKEGSTTRNFAPLNENSKHVEFFQNDKKEGSIHFNRLYIGVYNITIQMNNLILTALRRGCRSQLKNTLLSSRNAAMQLGKVCII
jgi:hypothetical protein